jgi:membrane protein
VVAYSDLVPEGSVSVLVQQIEHLAKARDSHGRVLTLTPYIGFAMLLWSANKGTKALFRGLNAIFDCEESRGFVAFTLITLVFTGGAIIFLLFSLAAVLIVPVILKMIGLDEGYARLLDLLRWLVLLVIVASVIAVIYRYGPSRDVSGWRSILSGSTFAAVLWLGGTVLFSWYVSSFGSFVELYGSLSAVIGFMVWIWLSSIAVLMGAELDAALGQGRRVSGPKGCRAPALASATKEATWEQIGLNGDRKST